MVSGAEFGGAIGGLKAALEILKGLKTTADAVAINDAKIQLQGAIIEAQAGLMSAQEAQAAQLDRIRKLEQEIVQLKDWSAEAERYEPVDIYLGTIAYMPKLGMENGEPAHWLCPNCFQHRKKSFLTHKGQTTTKTGGRGMESKWACDACGLSTMVSYRCNPEQTQEERTP